MLHYVVFSRYLPYFNSNVETFYESKIEETQIV